MKEKCCRIRVLSMLLLFVILWQCIPTLPVYAEDCPEKASLESTLQYLQAEMQSEIQNNSIDEWTVLILERNGRLCAEDKAAYLKQLTQKLQETNGVLSTRKYTEYSRVVLTLNAIHVDPSDINGYDLLSPLADFPMVCKQGINGPAWALIAIDSMNGTEDSFSDSTESDAITTRERLILYLLEHQLDGGGWSLTDVPDDTTPMVLQALAPYGDVPSVKPTIDTALEILSSMQDEDGGFGLAGGSESISQAIIALASLKIDCMTDARFIKNGHTMLDALLRYQNADGSFRHRLDGNADLVATKQAALALTAYDRSINEKTRLYDMSDVSGSELDCQEDTQSSAKSADDILPLALVAVLLAGGVVLFVVFMSRRKKHTK